MLFADELEGLAASRGIRVLHAPGRRVRDRESWLPDQAAHLSDAQGLLHLVPDIAQHDVYLCGSAGWMDAARRAALDAGVPEQHIHLERFAW